MKKVYAIAGIMLAAIMVAYFVWHKQQSSAEALDQTIVNEVKVPVFVPDKDTRYLKVPESTTFGEFMTEQGVAPSLTAAIYEAASATYDLAVIKPGHRLDLKYQDQSLVKLVYDIDDWKQVVVELQVDKWVARKQDIDYQIEKKMARGTVSSSLYEAALSVGLDEGLVIELAEAFGSTIDFSMEVQSGDTFKVLYEGRSRDGEAAKPGRVLAAEFVNNGKSYQLYLWTDKNGKDNYYDEEGRASLKRFLRAPVAFRYISSGYTNNARYVGGQYQRFTANHLAIDYAANYGVPIRAVGDGRVSFAGWKNGYGNIVIIRHDGVYSTAYGHMSKILVKVGQAVSQSETIGQVGSTGFSTGPHVHFEMIKNGVKINPLQEVQPPSAPLASSDLESFNIQRDAYRELMK